MSIRRRKPPKSGIERVAPRRFASHLAWIRGCCCIVQGRRDECEGKIEAAHVRNGVPQDAAGGMGLKSSDAWTVPLCAGHHRSQHMMGEAAFAALYRVDLVREAEKHAAASPHLRRLEREREGD